MEPIVQMSGITKRFPGVVALDLSLIHISEPTRP